MPKTVTKADPKFSAGARAERKAIRTYLRRLLQRVNGYTPPAQQAAGAVQQAIDFVVTRQGRYDAAPGGLGK